MKLSETTSVCPVCLKQVGAAYVKRSNAVYLEKTCVEHGDFSCLVARDAADFAQWHTEVVNIPPKEALTETEKGCPHDCGPCAQHLQTACCVLIDITDRCNQACSICFASSSPEEKRDMPFAEIEAKYDELLRLSESRKFNIQLSGGEPTVREDLPQIVKMAKDKGFEYVQLNTNGKRLGMEEGYAEKLKTAGVDAVFLQFDGMSDEIYQQMRNEPLLEIKKKAIACCRKARLPVALVPTLVRGINDQDIGAMFNYMLENVDVIKGIHFQPVSFFGRYPDEMQEQNRFTMFDTINEIAAQTNGIIAKETLRPIATGHNLCCFYATYLKNKDGSIKCTSADKPAAGCCGAEEACCPPDIEIITKDRDYVLTKWKMAENDSQDGFDRFLNEMRNNNFTLTGMAFQDAMSLDTERVKRCRVQVLSRDNRLIPFCSYNLTNFSGEYLYRTENS